MTIKEENERQIRTMRENFKALRETRGWSMEALAENAGIDKKILADMEEGRDFEVKYLFQLCWIYGIKTHEIFLCMDRPL